MYKDLLERVGLSEKEAQMYELLVTVGPSNMKNILFHTKCKRGIAYYTLARLKEKELVVEDVKNGRAIFSAKNPEQLELFLAKQKNILVATEDALAGSLSHLRSLFQSASLKPGVKFYEGVAGIKAVHREILAEKKEILAYVLVRDAWDKELGKDFWQWYYSERHKRKIAVRAIAVDNAEGKAYKERDRKELRATKLINAALFPLEIEKNICGKKVAFFSLKPGEQLAVLIESAAIAATERSIFELVWKSFGN